MKAFLMIGQSNMSGRGVIGELPEISTPHVLVLRPSGWEAAREPVVLDKPDRAGEGMGLSFGSAIHQMTGESVGLIPCSLGGSSLSEWSSGSPLFENAVTQALRAVKEGAVLSGILWHQGESDSASEQQASSYCVRLEIMTAALLARLNTSAEFLHLSQGILHPLPFLVGELGDFLSQQGSFPYASLVTEQLHAFADAAPHRICVSARDLPHKGDFVHFSASAQRRLGLRYALSWMDVMDKIRFTP